MAEIKYDISNAVEAMCKAFKADGYFVGKWIPCSERMPEIENRVLIYANGEMWLGELCDNRYYDTDIGFMEATRVTHWMPLPEPPEGGAEDA